LCLLNEMNNTPIVFLIDLDGTLQGNISPQVNEFEFQRTLNSHILFENKIKHNTQHLFEDLKKGLLRPFVRDSLLLMKSKHPNIEFFIYTASSDAWGNFLIPKVITHAFGESSKIINKPFLTRKHCFANGLKSIKKVFPLIKKSLGDRYKLVSEENVFLVDNNIVLLKNEMSNLILCPTYEFTKHVDIFRNISVWVIKSNMLQISKMLCGEGNIDLVKCMETYYKQLYIEEKSSIKPNGVYKTDTYWKDFADIVISNEFQHREGVLKVVKELKNLYHPR
jgi:hypothetical protein